MSDRKGASLFSRVALLLLTVYALAMIVPDLLRVVRPLGSFGLAMDGDGRIYDVRGPFEAEQDSPAWRAGLRAGDRLDLAAMSCARVDTIVCASLLSQWGGVTYVTAGREATLIVAPSHSRTLGARSQAHRRAAAHQSPARRRRRARHDRRRSGCARRGLAGVDAPWPHDLGLLHLCDPVQSRPGVSVLGLAPALAPRASGAERHFPGDAGRRLYRAPALRTEGAGRSRRRTMADDRARPAGSGDCVPGRRARQHGDRLRLSGRNLGAEHAVDRLCRQRRRARDPDRSPAGSFAPRLSAHPLGDLGLPDRPSGLSARPALSANLIVRRSPRQRSGAGGGRRRALPRQRDPVPVRRRGGAAANGGQRLDPASPGDRLRPSAQRAGPLPSQADRRRSTITSICPTGPGSWSLPVSST